MTKTQHMASVIQNRTTEQTELGAQYLVDGVAPVTLREKLEAIGEKPKRFRNASRPVLQKPCDIGLFDEAARNQFDLF